MAPLSAILGFSSFDPVLRKVVQAVHSAAVVQAATISAGASAPGEKFVFFILYNLHHIFILMPASAIESKCD